MVDPQPASSPVAAVVTVGTANNYSTPPAASQPSGANTIDALDNRISGMSFFNAGSIYASVNTNGGSGTPAFVLFQVQPFVDSSGNITSARILDEIVVGNANSWWFVTQQPDTAGNVTTIFNFSSSSTFASLAYMSRRASQTPGTIPDLGVFLLTGQAFYNQFQWGDYTAVAPGGIASGGGSGNFPVMFFAGMWAQSDGTWGHGLGQERLHRHLPAIARRSSNLARAHCAGFFFASWQAAGCGGGPPLTSPDVTFPANGTIQSAQGHGFA